MDLRPRWDHFDSDYSPELIKLSQKITGHGMVALRLQDEYEDKVLS